MTDVEELSARSQAVLRVIVSEYVKSASPVGSKTISDMYELGVSSATIRNEMAALEELGYLTHPHTSAGRVPTEMGYRYFVQKLMHESSLSLAERRTISHQFHQARLDLDQWMRLAAAVLAHNAQGAALVTSPRSTNCQMKHLELISIRDAVVLLVLVLQAGIVKQQILDLQTPMSQEELSQVAARLTQLWIGCDKSAVMDTFGHLSLFERQVADLAVDTMQRIDAYASNDIYRDGLLNVLSQPEFINSDNAQQVVRALEERQLVESLVSEVIETGGLQVIIGGEGRWQDLSQISVVVARYGVADQATGALGVLGPVRMQYGRVVSVVRYVAQLMSDLMFDVYGN